MSRSWNQRLKDLYSSGFKLIELRVLVKILTMIRNSVLLFFGQYHSTTARWSLTYNSVDENDIKISSIQWKLFNSTYNNSCSQSSYMRIYRVFFALVGGWNSQLWVLKRCGTVYNSAQNDFKFWVCGWHS